MAPVMELFQELRRLLEGIRLTQEVSPRLRAKVMAYGELASSYMGFLILQRRGFKVKRVDSRHILKTTPRSIREQSDDKYLEGNVIPSKTIGDCRFDVSLSFSLPLPYWSLSVCLLVLGPGSWVLGLGSWVLGLGSWVLGLGSWVLGLGSWVLGLGSWVLVFGVWVLVFGSWVLVFGSWFLIFGSWVLGLGCWSLGLGLGSW
jgi:hypothetical protein